MAKMIAADSFYSSETLQVKAGQEFEVNDERAKEFKARGLANYADEVVEQKAAAPTENKARTKRETK